MLLRMCGLVAVSVCLLAPPASASSLRGRLGAALAGFHGPGTGAIAVDLTTGKAVYAHNAGVSLLPASNQKLALTYAALIVLGPTFRIRTELLGEGYLVDGVVWHGDLILRGYGDPTLDSGGLLELARNLRATGIRRVTGNLIADESWFDARRGGPGWKSYFVPEESSPLSALSVHGADAFATARLLRKAFRIAGIRVHGRTKVARAGGWPLAMRYSAPLTEILRQMDVESDNHIAELLLKQLGAVDEGTGSSAAGAEVALRIMHEASIPVAGVRIVDGSGLSPRNRLTAGALIGILIAAWHDPLIRPSFIRSLAVAGRTGTLEDRMLRPPVRGAVLAKTGTTSESSALSGYVKGRFAFAVLQNGRPVSLFWARRAQDRFATVLARQ